MAPDRQFWEERYHRGDTPWDVGGASTPLRAYIDQLEDRDLRILFPGAGRAYEAEHAHRRGFRNVFVLDLTDAPLQDLLRRCPDFPRDHLLVGDLFTHTGTYDRIVEQTCFCAIDPALRPDHVRAMHRMLRPGGRLVGVLFDDPLNRDRPPFGGSQAEYERLFRPLFPRVRFARCHNSIGPRSGRELWMDAPRD
ncbi:MAG: methyltransferase domain-containing protein [Flavobacteriales bacterium]|nr:hypothetical protein [Flavobacteriales bacterium]MCC6575968.1 methyltransferase domain-containing protein [Flavobacteriales bacterium]NUQ14005.1 methyltransferase domain-containing protein [Flavobacteriales bacterium]